MNFDFNNKRALVTGGTSGIGRAIASELARNGCQVTATGLTDNELDAFDARSLPIETRQLDVSDAKAVERLAASIDPLDILVNAAGTIRREGREHSPDDFAAVVDVNLNGTMRMCSACLPLLKRSRGCVLNIASMLSFFGSGKAPAYSASKGGVAQLTKSLAIAWAEHDIRVNAIAPGWIQTPLTQPLADDPAISKSLIDRTPMKRWGKPEDVVGPALFLWQFQDRTPINGVRQHDLIAMHIVTMIVQPHLGHGPAWMKIPFRVVQRSLMRPLPGLQSCNGSACRFGSTFSTETLVLGFRKIQ